MSLSEREARNLIRQLRALFQELETSKTTNTAPGERLGHNPPIAGPRSPGGAATELDVTLTTRLAEVIRDVRNHIQPARHLPTEAPALLWWLAFNLQAALRLDFIDDVLDELSEQRRELLAFLKPATTTATGGKVFNTAPAVLQILAMHGHHHTREDLRNWHRRGCITRIKGDDGRYRFDAQQILEYLERG